MSPEKPRRRQRYPGKNPRHFSEKYKEHAPDRYAVDVADLGQIGVQRLDALEDELDPPVGARQRVEEGAVEDEGAPDPARRPQGVVQRGVVDAAQVAAKPDQGGVQGLLHRAAVS